MRQVIFVAALLAVLAGGLSLFSSAQGTAMVQGVRTVAPASTYGGGLMPVIVTVTWPVQFATDNVTAVCMIEDSTGGNLGGSLSIRNIRDVTALGVKVFVWNPVGATPHAGVVHCVGVHP
jgi:hypothetical protein